MRVLRFCNARVRILALVLSTIVYAATNCIAAPTTMVAAQTDQLQGNPQAKGHLEKYQTLYASQIALFAAILVYLFQQNFSKWWSARQGWLRIHAIMATYLGTLRRYLDSEPDGLGGEYLDLMWIVKSATDSGINPKKLATLLDLVSEIHLLKEIGVKSLPIQDVQNELARLQAKWQTARADA